MFHENLQEKFLMDWLVYLVSQIILLASIPGVLVSVWPSSLGLKPIFMTVFLVLVSFWMCNHYYFT